MAPVRDNKRESSASMSSTRKHVAPSGSPSTPHQRSPIKKRKMGINLHHKQALIDNLQLEITERARRLRAQYHLQAQGLRSRIEIRINRIPMALRKAKMGDLLSKYLEQEQRGTATRPPPVPAKDVPRASPQKPAAARGHKRMSDGMDKENEIEHMENPKKRPRGVRAPDAAPVRPAQVLSPTSSNSRLNRDRSISPTKSQIARPASPLKGTGMSRSAAATSVLSSMVEKAKATRAAGTRKVTTTSNTSASSTGTTTAGRTRGGAAPAAAKAQPARPATRTARRVSDNSEASEGSATAVVRKPGTAKAAAPAAKKTMMGTIRKGVAAAGARKAAAKAAAPAVTTTSTGRVLRKRA